MVASDICRKAGLWCVRWCGIRSPSSYLPSAADQIQDSRSRQAGLIPASSLASSTVPCLDRNLRKCLLKSCSSASPTVPSAILGMCVHFMGSRPMWVSQEKLLTEWKSLKIHMGLTWSQFIHFPSLRNLG